jgi:hypothetical protein
VINFVLVAVLASTVTDRKVLVIAALLSSIEMVAIAWDRPLMRAGHGLAEARFESIAQFLPTYLVVVVILWLRSNSTSTA